VLLLNPLLGGIAPAEAWKMLRLFESEVLPALSGERRWWRSAPCRASIHCRQSSRCACCWPAASRRRCSCPRRASWCGRCSSRWSASIPTRW